MGHSVRLLGVVVLALGLPGGCVKDVGIGGREQLAACYAAYERGDDGAAIEKANEFLRDNSPSVRDDEAHYLRGMAESRRGRPGEAREAFTKAAASRRPTVRAHALLALGDLAVAAGDLGSGETFYRRSLSEGTMAATPAQQAYIRLGRILQRQGQWAEADIVFSRAMHYFGHTQEGKWAATRIHGRAWTIQAGAYAQEANARAAMVPLIKAKLPARTEDVNPSPPGHRRTVTRNQISYQ
jgi:tetratricopeptide (TPR) repeat protein